MRPDLYAFVDELQKLARSRAAKELIKGTLSSGTLGRVRSGLSAARPPEVMAKGLARGSTNIAKKLNVPIREGTMRGAARKGVGLVRKAMKGGKVTPAEGLEAGAPVIAAGMGGGGLTIPKHMGDMGGIYLHEGQPLIRYLGAGNPSTLAGKVKGVKELAGGGMSAGERKYLGEIIKRHEVDEARAMASRGSFANRRGGMWTPSWREKKVPFMREPMRVGGGSHADPRVLMEESRNLTFAPENVRRTMQNVRDVVGERQGLARQGVSLGERTPLAGSRQARQVERRLSDVPEVTHVQGGQPVHLSPEFQQEAAEKLEKAKELGRRFRGLVGR